MAHQDYVIQHPPRCTNQNSRGHSQCLFLYASSSRRGCCDEKPSLLSRNEGFILQPLRGLLEESPQLSAPSGVTWAEESCLMEGHVGFLGHLAANDWWVERHKSPAPSPQQRTTVKHIFSSLLGLAEAFVGTELLLSFSVCPVLLSPSLLHRCWLQEHSLVNILHSISVLESTSWEHNCLTPKFNHSWSPVDFSYWVFLESACLYLHLHPHCFLLYSPNLTSGLWHFTDASLHPFATLQLEWYVQHTDLIMPLFWPLLLA